MHQNEPVFVIEVHEILDGVDVAKRNRLILAKALPVVQCVAVVAQDRRSLEQLTGTAERNREICGQYRRRFLAYLIDVCRSQETHADIIKPELWQVLRARPSFRPLWNLEPARVLAEAA